MRGRRRTWLAAAVAVLALALPGGALARVPQGFAGVVVDGPMWPTQTGIDLAHQLDVMVASGVESLRFEIDWAGVEPYRSWSDVPAGDRAQFTDVDGLPLDLRAIDNLVALATQRGLILRPDVLDAPDWDSRGPAAVARTPRSDAPYGTFLTALVDRYGPHGSFWATHSPRRPIRAWQIWNEPNLIGYWATEPRFEPSYVALLKVAHAAIKHADPGAQVILAGMVNASWEYLDAIYHVPGARTAFDIAAVHPYTHLPSGVLTILDNFRRVMDRAGDRAKPILVDEFGWNSSTGKSPDHFGIETTESVQARYTDQALRMLAAQRTRLRLLGFDYNDWAGVETAGSYEFNFAGLFRVSGSRLVAKPVFGIFRRDVLGAERCRQKSHSATRCLRSG